ncbi:bidirectional sugar transporter SWEET6a-like [Canna indica]|uniref:Bidirectional sugar transporter SWEET n=1 Tax=Canna indica TaxID=4628 RepID=A0AAQ3K6E4_9LILI|nr:bidirectional sugar transporter SWEET6a-like [Canna indica]
MLCGPQRGTVIDVCRPTIISIIKRRSVEQSSPVSYLGTLLNCILWVFYGLPVVHPDSIFIVTINGAGFFLQGIYLTIFFIYAPRNGRLKVIKALAAEFTFMAAVIMGVLLGTRTHDKRSFIVGILCIIFGTYMYASPLSVMKLVIQTRSAKYMPVTRALASFLNGVCWTTYAFLPYDINLVINNGLGALLGLAQLILYACYSKRTKPKPMEIELVRLSPTTMFPQRGTMPSAGPRAKISDPTNRVSGKCVTRTETKAEIELVGSDKRLTHTETKAEIELVGSDERLTRTATKIWLWRYDCE